MTTDRFRLDGRVAIITGGSRGIGLAIAGELASAGAHVIIAARGLAGIEAAVATIQGAGGSAEGVQFDVQDIDAGPPLVDDLIARHGRLDILVNNAGINARGPALEYTPENFDRLVGVNLRGPYFLSQAAGRVMVAARRGKIVNIISANSFIGLNKISVYGMTKAGLAQMTRALATEWAKDNVQVNAVAPGFIITDLNRKLWANEALLNWVLGNTPAGRLGQVEDVVGAVRFLVSPASDFITGHALAVDGGFLTGGPWPL